MKQNEPMINSQSDLQAVERTAEANKQKYNYVIAILSILSVASLGLGIYGIISSENLKTKNKELEDWAISYVNDHIDNLDDYFADTLKDNDEANDKNSNSSDDNNSSELIINFNPANNAARLNSLKCLNCSREYNYFYGYNPIKVSKWKSGQITIHDFYGATGEYNFNFDSEVADTFVGWFGNGGDNYVFFLQQDGSVEYFTPYYEGKNALQLRSLDDVKDVVSFLQAGSILAGEKYGGGGTVLALRSDGYFYDLAPYIEDNWK